MAQLDRTSLINKISSLLADNNTREITEAKLREILKDVVDSCANLQLNESGNSFSPQTYSFVNQNSINISHNLNRKPIVEIVTNTGESVLFDKTLITTTNIVLNFNFNISGTITFF